MRFTRDHEYLSLEGSIATVGVSDHAQSRLGDIVYVELPEIGAKFVKGAPAAMVESVKAASDVFSPVGGEVVAINAELPNQPSLVNDEAQGRGWLFRLRIDDPAEVESLMDEAAYAEYVKTNG